MAAPTRRERLGVTQEMIEAFGPIVFDLSTNVQDRRGDPVRLLQFDEISGNAPVPVCPMPKSRRGSGSPRIR